MVAFGSGQKVTLASVNGTSLKVITEISDNRGDVLALAFSKDGTLLAAGDVRPFLVRQCRAIANMSSPQVGLS